MKTKKRIVRVKKDLVCSSRYPTGIEFTDEQIHDLKEVKNLVIRGYYYFMAEYSAPKMGKSEKPYKVRQYEDFFDANQDIALKHYQRHFIKTHDYDGKNAKAFQYFLVKQLKIEWAQDYVPVLLAQTIASLFFLLTREVKAQRFYQSKDWKQNVRDKWESYKVKKKEQVMIRNIDCFPQLLALFSGALNTTETTYTSVVLGKGKFKL